MPATTQPRERNFYAVFIGINDYSRNPLSGCINDVLEASAYFERLCRIQEEETGLKVNWMPQYYLAPLVEEQEKLAKAGLRPGDDKLKVKERKADHYYLPTRRNIIDAFLHFEDANEKQGDICLLYYSGHGSYVHTFQVQDPNGAAVFSDYEPTGEMQTLVTIDSREEGKHDILDKELGYLIAKTLSGKMPGSEGAGEKEGVHFLSIMDCCHSGSNTRDDKEAPTARMAPSGSGIILTTQIEGYNTGEEDHVFYKKFKEGQKRVAQEGLKHARYINLSASRNTERAHENLMVWQKKAETGSSAKVTQRNGYFTYCLLNALERAGAKINYRELIRRVEMDVRSMVDNQVPILGKTELKDDNLYFLGNEFVSPPHRYNVRYDDKKREWYIDGGKVNGLFPSPGAAKTTIRLADGSNREIEVREVKEMESVLDNSRAILKEEDKRKNLQATIRSMPFPRLNIRIAEPMDRGLKDTLEATWLNSRTPYNYFQLALDTDLPADYEIRVIQENGAILYSMVRRGSDIPIFPAQSSISALFGCVEKVGKWEATRKLANPDTGIPRSDIEVRVEVLENEPFFNASELKELAGRKWKKEFTDPDEVVARTVNGLQPAIKVEIINKSASRMYFVESLFLNSKYGIRTDFLDGQDTEIGVNTRRSVKLRFPVGNDSPEAIPLMLDSFYHKHGITEVEDYLILLVSRRKFPSLENYNQPPIDFENTRGEGFAISQEKAVKADDWFTIPIKVKVVFPLPEEKIRGGGASTRYNDVLRLSLPGQFESHVHLTNLAAARRRAKQLEEAGVPVRGLFPGPSLWAGFEGGESVFNRRLATAPDVHLSILELSEPAGTVDETRPLEIEPEQKLHLNEALISVGYDSKTGLYIPVGLTEPDGKVCIKYLPEPTPEVIGADGFEVGPGERSISGSVKLFFQKVLWSKLTGVKDFHTLSLVHGPKGAGWDKTEFHRDRDIAGQKQIREALESGRPALLLIHGITGDSDGMLEAVFKNTNLHENYTVLAFDYENLNTTVPEAAEALYKMLEACGVQDKQLTIIGHSTGGLVGRWLIERQGGARWVQKLIQAGTPNGGLELARIRKKVAGWLTMGINGFAFFQPYLPFLAFAGRLLDGKLFKSLDQLVPGEGFIQDILGGSKELADGVPYNLIVGNTENIEAGFEKNDPLFRKIWAGIRSRSRYLAADMLFDDRPNDLIVRGESMKALPWAFADIAEPRCDHLRYFENEEALEALERFLS
ncbi:MAG: alpha/beta hydrolase [Lewinellaceae bacterium]|nr:alpha/beta hydrolase [Lewinellaceae bacterium]